MKAFAEASAFGGLALVLHVAVWAGLSGGGLSSAGDGGDGALSVQGADPALAALVAVWQSPPAAMTDILPPTSSVSDAVAVPPAASEPPGRLHRPDGPAVPPRPAPQPPDMAPVPPPPPVTEGPAVAPAPEPAPAGALPELPAGPSDPGDKPAASGGTLSAPFEVDAGDASTGQGAGDAAASPAGGAVQPPPQRPQVSTVEEEIPRPVPRPEAARTAIAPPVEARGSRAAGEGARAAEGQRGPAEAGLSDGARETAMATWGGLIRAHIMRRSPRAPAAGQVLLRLDISADGTLRAAELARSSGTPALDRAALAAVRAAGRFPPAPAALGGGVHRFTLPLRFD